MSKLPSLSRRAALRALGTVAGFTSFLGLGSADTAGTSDETGITRTVAEGYEGQDGRAIIRTNPTALDTLGVRPGDPVAVGRTRGGRGIPARIWRSNHTEWDAGIARIGRYIRRAAGTYPGDDVILRSVTPDPAEQVTLAWPPNTVRLEGKVIEPETLAGMVHRASLGRPVISGTKLPLPLSGSNTDCLDCYILKTDPNGHIYITEETDVIFTG